MLNARAIAAPVLALAVVGPAAADTILFNSDPFAGSTALSTPGRQVFANLELFLPAFDVTQDVFAFDTTTFAVPAPVAFASSLASGLPVGGPNVVVLLDTDNDANPATAFNAGTAANLIAAAINTPGPGWFIYWNSSLNVNRLVFSTDLSDPTADLAVLARITSPTGADAIAALPTFNADNFAIVPAPATAGLLLAAAAGAARRRR